MFDTKVDWILSAPVNNSSASVNNSVLLSHVMEIQFEVRDTNNVLKQDLNKVLFDLKETNTDSESHYFDFKGFERENITFNENATRYEVGLSFKEYHEILSDNYFNYKERFNSLSKRFERYNELLQEVPLSETDNFDQVGSIHYLPHRPVIKDDRVTSIMRIVFDASSKIVGPSLNDCSKPGPLLTEPLLSVILRFRANKIVFIAYIEKTFL